MLCATKIVYTLGVKHAISKHLVDISLWVWGEPGASIVISNRNEIQSHPDTWNPT